MKIVIGRDPAKGCLKVSIDGAPRQLVAGTEGLSAMVSRDHLQLETEDGQEFLLTNLNENNVTYVDSVPVVKYTIKRGTPVTMGVEQAVLSWKALDPFIPKTAKITDLEEVWNTYQSENNRLSIEQQKANNRRTLMPAFTMGGSALASVITFVVPEDVMSGKVKGIIVAPFLIIGVIGMIYFFFQGNKNIEKFISLRNQLNDWFQHTYVCPQCGKFLGNQSYHLVQQMGGCPKCKTKFIS